MNNLFTVMKFTMSEMVKRKSFIISTVIILLLIVAAFNVVNLFQKSSKDDFLGRRVLIADRQNIFEDKLGDISETGIDYDIMVANESEEKIKQILDSGAVDFAIIIERQEGSLHLRYVEKVNTIESTVPKDLVSALSELYSDLQLSKINLSSQQILALKPQWEITIEQTSEEEVHGNVFVMMIMSMILFYAIYFCAYQVSSSITTEKTSKIMETLVTSTSPRTIILGKTIGIGIIGLLQMVLIVGTAYVTAKNVLDKQFLNSVLDMSNFTAMLGIITIVYFILGYFTFALLYALTGSTVSKPEDIQSANTPIALLGVVGFYLAYFTMMNPTGDLNNFAALFPFSSPFCMPFRVMMGLASTKDIILSIVILIVAILVIAKVAIKIYSSAILNYGSKISFKDMLKLVKSKEN